MPIPPAPTVTFLRLIESAPAPRRADRSGLGSLPMRAARHCEAVSAAAGFGWHIRPPMAFALLWDGETVWWQAEAEGLSSWMPLGAVQFPDLAARFDAAAPEDVRGFSPPFLTALQEPGLVQVWTGLLARTAPGWGLLVRGLANVPRHPGFEAYEGLVEADRWFGPLFTNLRLTRTGIPVRFDPEDPFLQVQPVPQAAHAEAVLAGAALVPAPEALTEADWADYRRDIVVPNRERAGTPPGRYAAAARRRRKREEAGAACPALPA